jgi:hypothetical protein
MTSLVNVKICQIIENLFNTEIETWPHTWLVYQDSFTQTVSFRTKILLTRTNDNLNCVYIKMLAWIRSNVRDEIYWSNTKLLAIVKRCFEIIVRCVHFEILFDHIPGNDGCRKLTTQYNKFHFFFWIPFTKYNFYFIYFFGGGKSINMTRNWRTQSKLCSLCLVCKTYEAT